MRTSYNPVMQRAAETALARRPDPLRARPRLARSGPQRRHQRRLAQPARGRAARARAIRPGARRWCSRRKAARATFGFVDGSTGTLPAGARLDAAARRRRLRVRRAPPRRGDRGRAAGRRLGAALDPRNLRRHGRRGGRHRPDPRHAGRLRRARLQLQPRHPGAAPARIDLQADRLFGRARQRHDPGLDHHRRPVLRQSGHAQPEMLPQFRRQRRRRPADDALGRSSSRAT